MSFEVVCVGLYIKQVGLYRLLVACVWRRGWRNPPYCFHDDVTYCDVTTTSHNL